MGKEPQWPYSNVVSAVFTALGEFYNLTDSDIEYSINNVLTGEAFGLFYPPADTSLSLSLYGLTSQDTAFESVKQITDAIDDGNVVLISKPHLPRLYMVWTYLDGGETIVGCEFEDGNDTMNSTYDIADPQLFTDWRNDIKSITFIKPNGETLNRDVLYKQALINGQRMLTQVEPPPEMDLSRVNYGYGQAVYDEWIRQLEQANADNSDKFYYTSPIFPHFIALYENRLHLYRFVEHYGLTEAIPLCKKLKDLAGDMIPISLNDDWVDGKIRSMTNNERRILLIGMLKKCREYEVQISRELKKWNI